MNFDGSSSNASSGNVDTLNATSKITLVGKYTLPTDLPIIANEVIQSTGNTLADGSMETIWNVAVGLGDVSSSTNTSVDDEIAVFNATSGKIIKNSNILSTSIVRNPVTTNLDFNNFRAENTNDIGFIKKVSTPAAIAGSLNVYANIDGEFHQVDENGLDTIVGTNFDQSLNTTDDVKFKDLRISNTDNPTQGEIYSLADARALVVGCHTEIANLPAQVNIHRARGTQSNPTQVLSNDLIGIQRYNAWGTVPLGADKYLQIIDMIAEATEDVTLNSRGCRWFLRTADNGATQPNVKIQVDTDGVTIPVNLNCDLINQGDYSIGENSGILEIKQNGNKRMNISDSFVDRYHFINGFGPNTTFHYGRGTEATPSAVISGDIINNTWEYGYTSNSSENIVSQVRTRATENFATNNLGVEMTFDTTNNGAGPTRTQKLKLDSTGVTLNDAYTMPLTDGNAGSMLTTDGSGQTSWVPTTGIFAQTGDSIVTATTVETSIIASGVGSLTVPANGFIVGNSFVAKVGGSLVASNGNTIQIRVKSGLAVLADFLVPMDASASAFELELDFTIAVVGIAGVAVIKSNGNFVYQSSGGGGTYQGANYNSSNITTFDTTIANTLDITVQHSNVAQVFNNNMCVLTRTYP